jgi:Uma2 family endonuclease
MTAEQAPTQVSPEEYLAWERLAETKSEYLGGYVMALSGASRRHNYVTLNIAADLHQQLRDRPCDVFTVDMRVKISETGDYTYPDVVVACGDVQFEDAELDTLLTPTVVIEVLSPSTERNDRGLKLPVADNYRRSKNIYWLRKSGPASSTTSAKANTGCSPPPPISTRRCPSCRSTVSFT